MNTFRTLLVLSAALAVTACGTKAPLLTPQCSKEERADTGTPAPTDNASVCGKLAKSRRNPSEPPNPISR